MYFCYLALFDVYISIAHGSLWPALDVLEDFLEPPRRDPKKVEPKNHMKIERRRPTKQSVWGSQKTS